MLKSWRGGGGKLKFRLLLRWQLSVVRLAGGFWWFLGVSGGSWWLLAVSLHPCQPVSQNANVKQHLVPLLPRPPRKTFALIMFALHYAAAYSGKWAAVRGRCGA